MLQLSSWRSCISLFPSAVLEGVYLVSVIRLFGIISKSKGWSDRGAKGWCFTNRYCRRTSKSFKLSLTNSRSSSRVHPLRFRTGPLRGIPEEDGWTYTWHYLGVFKQEQEQEKLREELQLTTNLLERKITNYRESNAKNSRSSARMSQEFIPLEERKNSIFRVSSAFK